RQSFRRAWDEQSEEERTTRLRVPSGDDSQGSEETDRHEKDREEADEEERGVRGHRPEGAQHVTRDGVEERGLLILVVCRSRDGFLAAGCGWFRDVEERSWNRESRARNDTREVRAARAIRHRAYEIVRERTPAKGDGERRPREREDAREMKRLIWPV